MQERAGEGRRLVTTTGYDAFTAPLVDPVIDMILVGDSVCNLWLDNNNAVSVLEVTPLLDCNGN